MAVLPLFKTLGLSGTQALALSSLANTGLSKTAIINSLKGTEFAVRRQPALAYLGYLQGQANAASLYKSAVAAGNVLPPTLLATSSTNQDAPYRYFFKLTVHNTDTEEDYDIFPQMGSDVYVDPDAALEQFTGMYFNKPNKYPERYVSGSVQTVLLKPGFTPS